MTREFIPHEGQKVAMQHLQDVRRAALWMPMGGGKTVSTLTALVDLDLVENVFPALVLAPLRVAVSTWPDEVAKWAHLKHLRVVAITGNPKQREGALATPADIYTMNYDNLDWLVDQVGEDWPFKTVVADEFTRLKSFRIRQGGKRAQALGKVAHRKVSRFIGLTGTPSPNGLQDLWGQTWFLDQGARLGKSFSAFEQRWFKKGYDGFSLQPLPHAQQEIENRLKDICLTVRVLEVDEPIHNPIMVDLPSKARKHYEDMEEAMFAAIGEEGVTAPTAAVRSMKCMQIANGAVYLCDDDGNSLTEWEEIHRVKIEALDSVIAEAGGMPVLVAYHFKSDLVRLQKAFPQGRVLDADPQTIRDWNSGKIPLLFAHPASAGHGLNLADGGNILAFFSINWNLEEHMQIIERIGPMRQKQAGYDRPVYVHYLLARNTIDEMLLESLRGKRSRQELLLEAMDRRKQRGTNRRV